MEILNSPAESIIALVQLLFWRTNDSSCVQTSVQPQNISMAIFEYYEKKKTRYKPAAGSDLQRLNF